MVFVDTSVFVYAVGRSHPLKKEAEQFFLDAVGKKLNLIISAEVLQELLHIYLPAERIKTLDAALELATKVTAEVIDLKKSHVILARSLMVKYPNLSSRDLVHLAVCVDRNLKLLKTFDRHLHLAAKDALR